VEKFFYFDIHKLHNMTNVSVKNLCFYRAKFSIQSLFETMPCPLKHQHENHTGVLASDSRSTNISWTGDRWVKRWFLFTGQCKKVSKKLVL